MTAGRAGVRSSILTVPVTFPPEDVPNGELLSGLPLPDIRGTMGTFYYFATDLSRYEEGNTEFGGILKRLVFESDVARTELVGPPNPIVRQQIAGDPHARDRRSSDSDRAAIAELQAREDVRLPMTIRWNRPAKTATVDIDGQIAAARAGQDGAGGSTSTSRVNFLVRVHGMAQLLLMNADNELQLYVSPVNWKPDNPPVPMSSPRVVLRRSLRAARLLPDARLGRGHLAAQRRPHGRADVHGRPLQGVRRSRAGDPQPARRAATGTCSSASSNRPIACST